MWLVSLSFLIPMNDDTAGLFTVSTPLIIGEWSTTIEAGRRLLGAKVDFFERSTASFSH
jgi:hypothetical protein